jgi:hypothetical protein
VPGVRAGRRVAAAQCLSGRLPSRWRQSLYQELAASISGYVGKARAQGISGDFGFENRYRHGGITQFTQDVIAVANPFTRDGRVARLASCLAARLW